MPRTGFKLIKSVYGVHISSDDKESELSIMWSYGQSLKTCLMIFQSQIDMDGEILYHAPPEHCITNVIVYEIILLKLKRYTELNREELIAHPVFMELLKSLKRASDEHIERTKHVN